MKPIAIIAWLCVVSIAAAAPAEDAAPSTQPSTRAATQPASRPAPPAKQTIELLNKAGADFTPVVEKVRGGQIDWTRDSLRAVGTGKARTASGQDIAMAKRAARLVAARNALLAIGGVRVGPGGKAGNLRTGRVNVEGVLKHFQEVSSTFDAKSRTATVVLLAPLHGAEGSVTAIAQYPPVEADRARMPEGVMEGEATVVVVDARGMGLKPCLLPTMRDAEGRLIYSAAARPAAERKAQPAALWLYKEQVGVRRETNAPVIRGIAIAKQVAAQAGRTDPDIQEWANKNFKKPLILTADVKKVSQDGAIPLTAAAGKDLQMHSEAGKLMSEGKLIILVDSEDLKGTR